LNEGDAVDFVFKPKANDFYDNTRLVVRIQGAGPNPFPSALLEVDKATVAVINKVLISEELGGIDGTSGMDFGADGVLYVADGGSATSTDRLFALNPSTGFLTEIGSTGLEKGLAGLEFVPHQRELADQRAVWMSSAETFEVINDLTNTKQDQLLAFLRSRKVTTVYLFTGNENNNASNPSKLVSNPNRYAHLISGMKAEGLTVYGLIGGTGSDNELAEDGLVQDRFSELLDYNADRSSDDERFDGLNLDVEPWVRSDWRSNLTVDELPVLREIAVQYLDMSKRLLQERDARDPDFVMGAVIPFFFDRLELQDGFHSNGSPKFVERDFLVNWGMPSNGSTNQRMSQQVQDLYDYVSVLSFRDFADDNLEIRRTDGMIDVAHNEVVYAGLKNKTIVLGAETTRQNPSLVTFFEEGEAYMEEQLAFVTQYFGSPTSDAFVPGFSGFAIQDLAGYRNLTLPQVTGVQFAGTSWSDPFVDHLAAAGLGAGGFAVPTGSSAQLQPLSWINLDQILVQFNEDVQVKLDDLTVTVDDQTLGLIGFSYDRNALTATWTLDAVIDTANLVLRLSDSVYDQDGNLLDGDWVDTRADLSSGSGDRVAGGDFVFSFNVLPGEVVDTAVAAGPEPEKGPDQPVVAVVTQDDAQRIADRIGLSIGDELYDPRLDLNGDGFISQVDLELVNGRLDSSVTIVPAAGDPVVAPQVTGVFVRSTAWDSDMLDQLGDPFGLLIPTGSIEQLLPLRLEGLDQLSIRFSEAVNVELSDLVLVNANLLPYNLIDFAYDPASLTATWTLDGPIGDDRLNVSLSDEVTNSEGHALDGEWSNGVDRFADGSGNGIPGGPFDFGFSVLVSKTSVADRHIFYNNSVFDGNNSEANAADDNAIAPDFISKALLPSQTATFQNYTSYSRGINGIMIDVANLADPLGLREVDFEFHVGNDNTPQDWMLVAAKATVKVRAGEGVGGSDRVTIIWPDGAIKNEWLQVRVKANHTTGLDQADVFYFGNAVGETGDHSANAIVDVTDFMRVRSNTTNAGSLAEIDNPYDYDRNQRVNVFDVIAVLDNRTDSSTALKLIDAPQAVFASAPETVSPSPVAEASSFAAPSAATSPSPDEQTPQAIDSSLQQARRLRRRSVLASIGSRPVFRRLASVLKRPVGRVIDVNVAQEDPNATEPSVSDLSEVLSDQL